VSCEGSGGESPKFSFDISLVSSSPTVSGSVESFAVGLTTFDSKGEFAGLLYPCEASIGHIGKGYGMLVDMFDMPKGPELEMAIGLCSIPRAESPLKATVVASGICSVAPSVVPAIEIMGTAIGADICIGVG
jgi:hypothetical protein